MRNQEFIEFIKELGFQQTWGSNSNSFSLSTDVVGKPNQNYMTFHDQLNIHIDYDKELVQLSLSQMSSHMTSGKNFGYFSLKTFGEKNDLQLELFLSFILGSFNQRPKHIIQLMRDKKIKNILKE
jgi:hypothetical protein